MQIKAADGREADVQALTELAARPDVDGTTRRRIEAELRQIQAGARGEREAAYEIEFHFHDNPNRMTIHDLRLEVDDRVAQIDHLILDRLLGIWVCESKHFSEGVAVDDFGEWTGFYRGRAFGIGSPIEQNRKHITVLNDVFTKRLIELPKRLGITIKPDLRSLILVSKQAQIKRPRSKAAQARVAGLASVIKIDQLIQVLNAEAEGRALRQGLKMVGANTLEAFARRLAALHRPTKFDWPARFGLSAAPAPVVAMPERAVPSPSSATSCAGCGTHVSQAVIDFCNGRGKLFGNRILCMDCQRKARKGQI